LNRLCTLFVLLLVPLRLLGADPEWNASEPRRVPQPVQEYFSPSIPYSHVGAAYGAMGPGAQELSWREGGVCADRLSAAWAGVWHQLASPPDARETIDFSRCYPNWIEPQFQPRCLAVAVRAKGHGPFKIELKGPHDELLWHRQGVLRNDDYRDFRLQCPTAELTPARALNWVLDRPGTACIDSLGLEIENPVIPFSTRVFLLSYAKLSRCYNTSLGTVRDKAHIPAGRQDTVPASGMFGLATCAAWDLGIVSREFAEETLHRIHRQIESLPKRHGLLPHFIRRDEAPQAAYQILPRTEYSSVDTALYYQSMLLAAQMLDDQSLVNELTQACRTIEFDMLRNEAGFISHGIRADESTALPSVWSDWGGETALVLLLQAIADPRAAPKMDRSGRVYQGVGFIAEIQSLFYRQFSAAQRDRVSGVNWLAARRDLFQRQRTYFEGSTLAARLGIFGLSAGEGFRGQGYLANGVEQRDVNLIHPHYLLLSWEHWEDPAELYAVLRRMEAKGLMPPWGLVENATADVAEYLPMNGSLNASFESLAAYHLWARANGQPDAIYLASEKCQPLRRALATFYR
jgi:hypothetical protein